MATELRVSSQTIFDLFTKMDRKKFVIPEYQRPYSWDKEHCETLWNDLVNFFESAQLGEYFLGSIVVFKTAGGTEIIDGQQRITSLLLLLRAFYHHLEGMKETDEETGKNIRGLKIQLEPCLWELHPVHQTVEDRTKIHLASEVVTEQDNQVLHAILADGKIPDQPKNLYSSNYKYFYEQSTEYSQQNPYSWPALIVAILQKCIVLPIECESVESGLTIFNTLNDRGMSLSDTDIFKAHIYKSKSGDAKKDFIDEWKELIENSEHMAQSKLGPVHDLLRYYMHIIRGKDRITTSEVGLRFFYAADNYAKLKTDALMPDLFSLCDFWSDINTIHSSDTKKHQRSEIILNDEAQKYLHCLEYYPNEFWKLAVSAFFHQNKTNAEFETQFVKFLKQLTAFLFLKFIQKPTVTAIKYPIFIACADILNNEKLKFNDDFDTFRPEQASHQATGRLQRSLILLYAYLHPNQNSLITQRFEIEHIFPKKWQSTNYNGWNLADAKEYLEKLGNKVAIEKKVNIQAGNGYFGKKKEKYKNSNIVEIQDLSNYPKDDWLKEDIETREAEFTATIYNFFKENLSNQPLKPKTTVNRQDALREANSRNTEHVSTRENTRMDKWEALREANSRNTEHVSTRENTRMDKREALQIVNSKNTEGHVLTGTNTRFANINKTAPVWWLDIPPDKFDQTLHILLKGKKTLLWLLIPARHFSDVTQIFYYRQDKDTMSLEISCDSSFNYLVDVKSQGTRYDFSSHLKAEFDL